MRKWEKSNINNLSFPFKKLEEKRRKSHTFEKQGNKKVKKQWNIKQNVEKKSMKPKSSVKNIDKVDKALKEKKYKSSVSIIKEKISLQILRSQG